MKNVIKHDKLVKQNSNITISQLLLITRFIKDVQIF